MSIFLCDLVANFFQLDYYRHSLKLEMKFIDGVRFTLSITLPTSYAFQFEGIVL